MDRVEFLECELKNMVEDTISTQVKLDALERKLSGLEQKVAPDTQPCPETSPPAHDQERATVSGSQDLEALCRQFDRDSRRMPPGLLQHLEHNWRFLHAIESTEDSRRIQKLLRKYLPGQVTRSSRSKLEQENRKKWVSLTKDLEWRDLLGAVEKILGME